MDIKINCDCGQRYAFEVEPENGRMPMDIACPACNVSGTEKANALIYDKLQQAGGIKVSIPTEPVRVPMRVQVPSAKPPPIAPPVAAPPVSQPALATPGSGLRLSRPSHTTAAPTPPEEQPVEDIAKLMAPPPPAAAAAKPARKIEKVFAEPHMGKSLLGAAIGAALMTAVWFGLWKGTNGGTWGIMALGVGWMAGFFARFIGRSEGSRMGAAVTAVALAFIFGFQFFRAWAETSTLRELGTGMANEIVEKEIAEAKTIVKAVPNGTDDEIRAYLAGKEGNSEKPSEVTEEAVKEFKTETLKEARDLADGKKANELRANVKKFQSDVDDSLGMRIWFWVRALGIFSIFSIIGGAVMAYRFGSGEG